MHGWVLETDEDVEYNQHYFVNGEDKFLLYSDRDGENWTIEYPDEEVHDLDSDNLEDAQKEAFDLASDWMFEKI